MAPPNPKIIDIINANDSDEPLVSLEYFPPRTEEGVKNLHARMDRMLETLHPAFSDITWGAGGSTADLSLDLGLYLQRTGHVANLHLTCTNLSTSTDQTPQDAMRAALQTAYDGGIRNIVALRGDPPAGQEEWKATEGGFTCALDLVQFIRAEYGDTFGIAVAGYPEGHPSAISEIEDSTTLTPVELARSSNFDGKTYCCLEADYKKEMDYLKRKVDAGADFIITQMFFDAKVFATFVQDCRKWGITCPIVPGLMCINAYPGFVKMTKFCKTRVPEDLRAKMEALKDDAAAVKAFGMEFGAQICRELQQQDVRVLHFYTLNLEKVVYGVLDQLGWSKDSTQLLAKANDSDAASQVAKGSAWARVGDQVETQFGRGTVLELENGMATIQISSWKMAEGQTPTVYLQQGSYRKVF